MDELVGSREIAERLGLLRAQAVHYLWRRDPTFPEPVYGATEGMGGMRVWYWPDVRRWAVRTGRLSRTGEVLRPSRPWKPADHAETTTHE